MQLGPPSGAFVTVQNGRSGRVASRGPAVICSKTGVDRPRLIDATAPRWSCQPGWAQLRPPGHRRPKMPRYGHPGAMPPVIQRCQGREMESAAGSPSPRRRPRAGPARLSSRTRAASEWSCRNRTGRDCAGGTLPRDASTGGLCGRDASTGGLCGRDASTGGLCGRDASTGGLCGRDASTGGLCGRDASTGGFE